MRVVINSYESDEPDVIEIDSFDVWNMDVTLAKIILPMLELIRKDKNGCPCVDNADVPESYRTKDCPPDYGFCNHKWDYVLDEMIYSFTEIQAFNPLGISLEAEDRVQNGLRLFSKYYRALWT